MHTHKARGWGIVLTVIAMVGFMWMWSPAASGTDTEAKKVFVCKYVGQPGVDERLQTGQNPISVSINAVDFPGIGAFFNDRQGRSYVLAFDTGQPEPPALCPSGTGTTTTTTEVCPEGDAALNNPTPTTCPPGSTTTSTTEPCPDASPAMNPSTTEPCETTTTSTTTSTTESTTTTTEGSTTTDSTTTTTEGSTTTTECVGDDCPVITPFAFGAAGAECQAEVPVIVIVFGDTFPELAGDTGTLFIDTITEEPVGTVEVVYELGATVEIIYPGAEVDAEGNIIDLPGWTLQENGLWVIDDSDAYLRDGLLLRYELGEETAFAEVEYPPESSTCANPPPPPPPTTPSTAPTTECPDCPPPSTIPVTNPPRDPDSIPPATYTPIKYVPGYGSDTLPRTGAAENWYLARMAVTLLGAGILLVMAGRRVRQASWPMS